VMSQPDGGKTTIIDLFFRVLGDYVEMGCQNFLTDDMATNCAGPIFATIDGKRGIAPMEVSGTKEFNEAVVNNLVDKNGECKYRLMRENMYYVCTLLGAIWFTTNRKQVKQKDGTSRSHDITGGAAGINRRLVWIYADRVFSEMKGVFATGVKTPADIRAARKRARDEAAEDVCGGAGSAASGEERLPVIDGAAVKIEVARPVPINFNKPSTDKELVQDTAFLKYITGDRSMQDTTLLFMVMASMHYAVDYGGGKREPNVPGGIRGYRIIAELDHTGVADGIAADRAEDSCIYTKTISARCEGVKDMQVATSTFTDAQIKKNQWFMPLSQVLSGTKKSEGADWTQALDRPDVARRINEVLGYTAKGAKVWIGTSGHQLALFGAIRKTWAEPLPADVGEDVVEEEEADDRAE